MKQGAIIWFTGLSGAGKTTIAEAVRRRLEAEGLTVSVIDGDTVRERLHRHLGFTEADIRENNRLIAGLCARERTQCDVVLVPIISPFAESRAAARAMLGRGFHEVYVKADLATVAARDTKGLYAKARGGEIDNLIGVSPDARYEAPAAPDLILDTTAGDPEECARRLHDFVRLPLAPQQVEQE